jgi:hypothetical protein
MVVEPESLCWVEGRKVQHRDGSTWADTFGQFPALEFAVTDGGLGLQKGLDLVRAERLSAEDDRPLVQGLDVFHTLREARRAIRAGWRRASEALDQAEAAQRVVERFRRRGEPAQAPGGVAGRAWRKAEQLWDQAQAVETAWEQVKPALDLWTAEGQLQTRAQAEARIAAALPQLVGPDWARIRRLLRRRETLAFLDQVHERLARLKLEPETLQLILNSEGLKRRRPHPEDTTPSAAAARGLALVRTVQLAKTDPSWQVHVSQVRQILRTACRASSLVECLNSVARMQQSRHRRMTQGLLDLKRLYWNLRPFRTGRRRGRTPYELLGLKLPALSWWELLKLPPEQFQQQLSAERLVA